MTYGSAFCGDGAFHQCDVSAKCIPATISQFALRLARDDLREIREHLSEFGGNPPKRFRASFERFVRQVSDMPLMYSAYEYAPSYRRAVLAYDYLVFYRVDENNGRVKVYRVLHGKRNARPLIDTIPH